MDFPGNSHKSEKPKIEKQIVKVVEGEVVKRRKPLGRRLKDIFFAADFKNAARYVTADVLLPATRDLIVNSITKGVERIIYGESMSSRRRGLPEYRPRVQYNSPVIRERSAILPHQPPRRDRYSIDDLILPNRDEADLVVERLIDILDKYESASVADLFELVGLPTSSIDYKWGWTSVTGIEVRQIREGYLIELPPVEPI